MSEQAKLVHWPASYYIPEEWEVTFPDGMSLVYNTKAEALRALRECGYDC